MTCARVGAGTRKALIGSLAAVACLACDSADRDARLATGVVTPTHPVQLTDLQPGPQTRSAIAAPYEETEWTVYAGGLLYAQLNCVGCHANGGGGIGPPFIDDKWIYGSEPLDIFSTIWSGRPNGMPAYGGRIGREQGWQLVAYVRAVAGLTPPALHRRSWLHMEGPAIASEPHTAASSPPDP